MATFSTLFLVAIWTPFLLGRVTYGHKLYETSINEDERQLCPNVNCAGKGPCSSNTQCASNQCCIDLINSMACCYEPGAPTHATTTKPTVNTEAPNTASGPATNPSTVSQSPTTDATEFPPVCTEYIENEDGCADDYSDCKCQEQSDCYDGEICCIYVDDDGSIDLRCYLLEPTLTTLEPGDKCPTVSPSLQCSPFHPQGTCASETLPDDQLIKCRANEICCIASRNAMPCCVVYP